MRPNVSETSDPLDHTLLPPTDGMAVSLNPPQVEAGPEHADRTVLVVLRMTITAVAAVIILRLVSYYFSPQTFLYGLTLASLLYASVGLFQDHSWRHCGWRAGFGPALWGLLLLASWTTGPAPLRFVLLFIATLAVAVIGDVIAGRYLLWMTEAPELDAEVRQSQRERWRERWREAPWDRMKQAADIEAEAAELEEENHPEKAELVRRDARELYELSLYPLGFLVFFLTFVGSTAIALRGGLAFFSGMLATLVFLGLLWVTAFIWNGQAGFSLVWNAVVHWLTHEQKSPRTPPTQKSAGALRKEFARGFVLLLTLVILPTAAYFPVVMFCDPDLWADVYEASGGKLTGATDEIEDGFTAMTRTPEGWFLALALGTVRPPEGTSQAPFLLATLVSLIASVSVVPLLLFGSWSLLCGRILVGFRKELLAQKAEAGEKQPHERWNEKVELLQNSTYEVETPFGLVQERDHLWLGISTASGTPVILDRNILHEHAWLLGDSGTGKTHRGLSPMVAQLVRRIGKLRRENRQGDSSVVIVDMKGDPALFQGARVEADAANIPFRWFTSVLGKSTYVFNPFLQSYIPDVSEEQFAGNMLQALGLEYGTDYGRAHFSYVNRDVLAPVLKAYGDETKSLEKLNRDLLAQRSKAGGKKVIKNLNRNDLEDARHLFGVVDSLSHYEALNAVPGDGHPPEVFQHAIDMAQVFEMPQVLYFYLPATFGGSSVKEIGRLALFSLLTAAAVKTHRGDNLLQTYLFIDEFQQIISDKLAIFLEMARSHRIGVIFANQHRSQLKTKDVDLVESVETVAFRQTFGASGAITKKSLVDSSGEALYHMMSSSRSNTHTTGGEHATVSASVSETVSEQIGPRLRPNDVARVSDHPDFSIVEVSRGKGFSRYAGLPLVVRTQYHISRTEFEDRERKDWPTSSHTITPTLRKKTEPSVEPPAADNPPPRRVEPAPPRELPAVVSTEVHEVATPSPSPSPAPMSEAVAYFQQLKQGEEAKRQRFRKTKEADDEPGSDPKPERKSAGGTPRKRAKRPKPGSEPPGDK